VYDCRRKQEVLTYDWGDGEWVNAMVKNGKRCVGKNISSKVDHVIGRIAEAVRRLAGRDSGVVLLSWYYAGPVGSATEITASLLWASEELAGMKGGDSRMSWPGWWPVTDMSEGPLTALEVTYS